MTTFQELRQELMRQQLIELEPWECMMYDHHAHEVDPPPDFEKDYGPSGVPDWVYAYFRKRQKIQALRNALTREMEHIPELADDPDDPPLPGDDCWGDDGPPEWVYDYYNEKWQCVYEDFLLLMSTDGEEY